nr:uncharacterized protein LOC104645639 [Solanum lycopersicum]
MGVTLSEKVELDSYQLKDVDQTLYVQWRDKRPLIVGLVTLEIIIVDFQHQFFPREMREEKVRDLINLRQRGKSVHEYSLEFVKFSKYYPSLVSIPRDQMSRFVTGVSEDCQSAMLHDNITFPSYGLPKKG